MLKLQPFKETDAYILHTYIKRNNNNNKNTVSCI